jgi:hypothetical protein
MQSAETLAFGETIKGGPAATMQSAATRNERMGVVAHDQATDVTAEQGVSVSETRVPGGRIVTEFVAGQAVGNNLNVPEERYVWLSFLVSSVVVFVSETRDSYTWSTS